MDSNDRRLYVAVIACALVPYVPALWNGFAMDDGYIILWNPAVHSISGLWRVFGGPYWPPDFGGQMYRPFPLATFVLDWQLGSLAWFHAVNLLWHAGAAVAVAALARRWAGSTAALAAGLIFAVHPVHVEAVANVIGRAELIAAVGACLAVYAAVVQQSVGWSALALIAGLLSKENAAVTPALIAWAWIVGVGGPPPSRGRMMAFAASWVIIGAAYLAVRATVLHPYAQLHALAPVFAGQRPVEMRLTAMAALADVARLLVFPLTLRADYSPAEREAVSSLLEWRFLLGLAAVAFWAVLLWVAWRRGRRVEALGLGWIAIAFLPVANLLLPTGILVAERALYLPSVGLALAAGSALARPPHQRFKATVLVLVLAGVARTALRVPVWRDDKSVTLSILEDSPQSYRGPARAGILLQDARQPAKALAAFTEAARIYDRDPALLVAAADAAYALGRPRLADSLLTLVDRDCRLCRGYYRIQAAAARSRGDSAVADSLLAWTR